MRLASAMALLVVSSKALRGVGGFRTGAALPSLGDRDQRPKGSRRGYVTATTSPPPPFIHYYYNDCFHVQMPEGHRFPMEKYRAFRNQAQQRLHPLPHITFHPSPLVSLQDLETTHERQYIQRYLTGRVTDQEKRESGFPWNRQHVDRTLSSVGGTVAAMHSIFRHADNTAAAGPQVGAHCAGGTHHAFRAKMEGFCIFSDIAVAANVALRDYPHAVGRILIVDLDVHQGNGNAVLFQDDDRVFTFSMHCKGNYFSPKQDSDLDVEVEPGAGDEEYLALLDQHLPRLFESHKPDLVFFQAGVDVHASDRLGRLELTRAGLQRRNHKVYQAVEEYKTKLVVCAGGGYPMDSDPTSQAYQDIINSHADVYVGAAEYFGGGSKMVPLFR